MRRLAACFLIAGSILLIGLPAQAYIGPGAGITMLGALWGVIAAVAIALASLVLWPLRALMRGRASGRTAQKETPLGPADK